MQKANKIGVAERRHNAMVFDSGLNNKESYASIESHLPALQLSQSPCLEIASKTTKARKKYGTKVKKFDVKLDTQK